MNVLFVSHDASRTGAPIVLLHLLRWLKSNTDLNITILLKGSGELQSEFEEIGKTIFFNPLVRRESIWSRIVKKIYKKFRGVSLHHSQILKYIDSQTFDLIYFNTFDSLDLIPIIKTKKNQPILAHIHENEFSIRAYYSNSLNSENVKSINHFIAVSRSTRRNLIENYNIDPNLVSLHYEFVSIQHIKKPSKSFEEIKNELGLGQSFVVGGSGLANWRKGLDLFLDLSVQMAKLNPDLDFKFVWVGNIDHITKTGFEYERERIKAYRNVIFTGPQKNPQDYFQVFDVFALTSREDPFPLVAIEAAALGKPILCFENSGGIPEMLIKGGGYVLPYGDTISMVNKIVELANNSQIYNDQSKKISEIIEEFDVEVIAPHIYNEMLKLI